MDWADKEYRFPVEEFRLDDIVLIEQNLNDQWKYSHAVFVTEVNLAQNYVWIHELSGSSEEQIGRDFTKTISEIYNYVIIRIDEFR